MRGDDPLVVVVGDLLDDIVVEPLEAPRADDDTRAVILTNAGGSGANQAAWMANMGLRVRFVGRVGREDADRHRRELVAAGVEPLLEVDDALPTGTVVVVTDGTMYTDRGAAAHLGLDGLSPDLLRDVDHLHVSGYVLAEPEGAEAIRSLVSAAGIRSIPWSIDPNSVAVVRRLGVDRFLALAEGAELIFPNLAEGRALTESEAPEEVASRLREYFPVVAMTMGEAGAIIADRFGLSGAPAHAVTVQNTTGAGDAFCAAVIDAILRGLSRENALVAGLGASSDAVQRPGGRPSPPHRVSR